ncbi:ribonucleotide reductase small chain [Vibrio phage 1.170.O._10N.261.52.C3]|nr:ribonucleotide reductase small chain [Vibrio phage 1.170.O._10N.261.52.C3]
MRPLFDLENNNNNSDKGYPLFLGGEIGIIDNINETYPEIAKLRDKMITDNWVWTEISLTKDAKDIQNPSLKSATDVMVKNLTFQHMADTVAQASIEILGLFCSNSELEGAIKFWSYNEYVHAMQYSEIIKTAFPDPNDLLEEEKKLAPAVERLKVLGKVFDDTRFMGYRYQMGEDIPEKDLRKQILLFMAALTSLEAVSFATSFAATFAIGRGVKAFDGTIKSVQLIAKDELETHVKLDFAIIDILRNKEGWEEEYQEVLPEIQKLFDLVIENEKAWAKYLFSEGRQIIGLNERNIVDYAYYLATPVYKKLGLTKDFVTPREDPLPWMSDYLDLDAVQLTPQEGQSNNYKVNITKDDDEGEELDF